MMGLVLIGVNSFRQKYSGPRFKVYFAAKNAIKTKLLRPKDAVFPLFNEADTKIYYMVNDKKYMVKSYVDAKTLGGCLERYDYTVYVKLNGKYTTSYIEQLK